MSSAFSKYNSEKIKRQTATNHEAEIKKPKFNDTTISTQSEDLSSLNHSNDKKKEYEEEEEVEEEEASEIDVSDSTAEIIGLETFNSANILFDLCDKSDNNNSLDNENDLILLALNSDEKFTFKGKLMVRMLHGCAEINGYNLTSRDQKHKNTFYNVYSPETHSHLYIRNKSTNDCEQESTQEILADVLENLRGINKSLNEDNNSLVEYLKSNLEDEGSTKSIILLKKLKSTLCNYFTKFDQFKHIYQAAHSINYITSPNDIKLAYLGIYPIDSLVSVMHMSHSDNKIINDIVQKTLDNRQKAEIVLACGGKDVGKSTYLRYLVNSLLNSHEKVAYLDCDPGQCEFTLSGTVQLTIINEPLLGPPHTHLLHSADSYFLGYLSPNDIPGYYLETIRKCLTTYQKLNFESINKIPLIVNTMGWNQGLGLCLLKEQINILQPTVILQLNCADINKNLPIVDYEWYKSSIGWPSTQDSSSYSSPIYKLYTIDRSAYKLQSNDNEKNQNRRKPIVYSAKHHRTIAILAYFSALQENQTFFRPIHHIKPYRIPWHHFAVHVSHMQVVYEELFRVLNASLVGLCKIDDKFIKKPDNQLPGYLDFNGESEANQRNILGSIKCFGFGIVRGINMETKEFYIITPEPCEKLNQVNLLVKGMINVPVEFFYEQDSETPCPYVAFVDNNSNNAVASEPIKRKYLIHQSTANTDKAPFKN